MALHNEIQFDTDICNHPAAEALLMFCLRKTLYPVKRQANGSCSTRVEWHMVGREHPGNRQW